MKTRIRRCILATAAIAVSAILASAQEPMPSLVGLRVGVAASSFGSFTLFETLDKTAGTGIRAIEGAASQTVSSDVAKKLDWNLTDAEVAQVRRRLQASRLTMPTYYAADLPVDTEDAAKLSRFVKALGIQTVVTEPAPGKLEAFDTIATSGAFNIAIRSLADPKGLVAALEARSKRVGISADLGAWSRAGIKPVDGLAIVKDRLMVVRMHDWDKFGAKGKDVPLGSGAAGIADLAREITKLGVKPLTLTVAYSGNSANLAAGVTQSHSFLVSKAIAPIVGELMDETSKKTPIRTNVKPEDREKIIAAAPTTAPAKPRKPRKLLVVDLNAAYGGHGSIAPANLALEMMAKNTGAFEAVFNNDLANLRWDKLRHYDALYLNNNVGPIFNAPDLRESLLRFVREGGGLAGHHGTSRASLDWPEFTEMLGAYSGPHGDGNERVMIKLDDPKSPINAVFGGKSFEFVDEYFRFPSPPYSREKLHILLSFDVSKTDMNQGRVCQDCARADNDYAISWIRSYGKGRVFFTSFGNSARVFATREIMEHFLAGIQFALGDLDADTTPSAKLQSK